MATLPTLRDRSLEVLHDLYHGDNPLLRMAAAGAGDELSTPLAETGGPSQTPLKKSPRWRKFFGFEAPDRAGHLFISRAEAARPKGKQHAAVAAGTNLVQDRSNGVKSTDGYHRARAFAQDGLSWEESRQEMDSRPQAIRHAGQAQSGAAAGAQNSATPFSNGTNQTASP